MTSISALIDFLMSLMRDEETKRAFENDPNGTMKDRGLQDVSAQDVRDARLIMADDGAARPRADGGGETQGYHEGSLGGGSGSAVREIMHTTNHFEIDQSKTIVALEIDNSRTNILDSFNSQDKVIAIQDNDTLVDVEVGNPDQDEDDKPAEDTGTPTDEATDEPTDEDKDGEQDPEPTPGPADEVPTEPGPPADEEPPSGGPADDPGPTDEVPDEPAPDPAESFPTEPEPIPDEAPEAFADPEADGLSVA